MSIPFRINNDETNNNETEQNSFQSFLTISNLANSINLESFVHLNEPRISLVPPVDISSQSEFLLRQTEINTSLSQILTTILNNTEESKNIDIVLDICSYQFSDTNKEKCICSICTEEFKNDDFISNLECSHIFHTKCIKEWGFYKQNCPLCRIKIPILTTQKENM